MVARENSIRLRRNAKFKVPREHRRSCEMIGSRSAERRNRKYSTCAQHFHGPFLVPLHLANNKSCIFCNLVFKRDVQQQATRDSGSIFRVGQVIRGTDA